MNRRIRIRHIFAFAAVFAMGSVASVGTTAHAQSFRLGNGMSINLGGGSGGSMRRGMKLSVPSSGFDTFYRGRNTGTNSHSNQSRQHSNSWRSSSKVVMPGRGQSIRSGNLPSIPLAQIVQVASGLSIQNGGARTSRSRGGSQCILNPQPTPARPVTPVVVDGRPVPAAPQPELTAEQQARKYVVAARISFKKSYYASALKQMDKAIKLVPENHDARQFRSLILFAKQDYKLAAADAYDAVRLGPIWTWDTILELYPNKALYSEHYSRLQRDAKEQRDSLDVQFLLAYHHLALGHLAAGEKQLRRVLEIQPNEPVSQQLLQVVVNLRAKKETTTVSTQ